MSALLKLSALLAIAASSLPLVAGHSFLTCSKYNGDPDWGLQKCQGFPRQRREFAPTETWAVHGTQNYLTYLTKDEPTKHFEGTGLCQKWATREAGSPADAHYKNPKFPPAVYRAGERVCLSWPAKNHVSWRNLWPIQTDGGVRLYMSTRGSNGGDPVDISQTRLVADFGKLDPPQPNMGFPRPGFQNCPRFVVTEQFRGVESFTDSTDRSVCYGCFNVPADLPNGVQTFVWAWQLNPNQPRDLYTSCYEARVEGGNGSNNNSPPPPTPVAGDRAIYDGTVFNLAYYKQNHADLARAFGDNDAAYRTHWKANGIREGRQAAANFKVTDYLDLYSDVRTAFGTDRVSAIEHWATSGRREGRVGTMSTLREDPRADPQFFDATYYANKYADLKQAFGTSAGSLLRHFLSAGLKECRVGSPNFSARRYLDSYPDLKRAFGENCEQALDHYISNGKREGRSLIRPLSAVDPDVQLWPNATVYLVYEATTSAITFKFDQPREAARVHADNWIVSFDVAGLGSGSIASGAFKISDGVNMTTVQDDDDLMLSFDGQTGTIISASTSLPVTVSYKLRGFAGDASAIKISNVKFRRYLLSNEDLNSVPAFSKAEVDRVIAGNSEDVKFGSDAAAARIGSSSAVAIAMAAAAVVGGAIAQLM